MGRSHGQGWKHFIHGGLFLLFIFTGCATRPTAGPSTAERPPWLALEEELLALAPTVRAEDARRAAACAYEYPLELRAKYRLVRPPLFHNLLVNLGFKQRGLCYHWAEDLSARLDSLGLGSLELRWGMARPGTMREHNAVVLTAMDQPFEEGVVLDAWRHSGLLYWATVSGDRYPWQEGQLAPPVADLAGE